MIPEGYRIFPLSATVDEMSRVSDVRGIAHADTVYPNFDEAIDVIKNSLVGPVAVKVRYLDIDNVEPNATMLRIADRIQRTEEKLASYRVAHSIHALSAKLITCTKCESRIAKDFVEGEHCPVCGNDLRSPYIGEQIRTYETLIHQLEAEYKTKAERHIKKLMDAGEVEPRVVYLVPVSDEVE